MIDALIYVLILGTSCAAGIFIRAVYLPPQKKVIFIFNFDAA